MKSIITLFLLGNSILFCVSLTTTHRMEQFCNYHMDCIDTFNRNSTMLSLWFEPPISKDQLYSLWIEQSELSERLDNELYPFIQQFYEQYNITELCDHVTVIANYFNISNKDVILIIRFQHALSFRFRHNL